MGEDFICNEQYTLEVFELIKYIMSKVDKNIALKITKFIGKEYKMDWVKYCRQNGIGFK